jgi:hypothetical protein
VAHQQQLLYHIPLRHIFINSIVGATQQLPFAYRKPNSQTLYLPVYQIFPAVIRDPHQRQQGKKTNFVDTRTCIFVIISLSMFQ